MVSLKAQKPQKFYGLMVMGLLLNLSCRGNIAP